VSAHYGPNSTQVEALIGRICGLTGQDVANLIAAEEASFPPGRSETCRIILELAGDTRDASQEARDFELVLDRIWSASRIESYRSALVDVWSCIPYAVVVTASQVREDGGLPGGMMRSLEDLVRRVIAAEVADDTLGEEMRKSVTRAWRWSKIWGPDPCPGE
jgi:hypothetical protein